MPKAQVHLKLHAGSRLVSTIAPFPVCRITGITPTVRQLSGLNVQQPCYSFLYLAAWARIPGWGTHSIGSADSAFTDQADTCNIGETVSMTMACGDVPNARLMISTSTDLRSLFCGRDTGHHG